VGVYFVTQNPTDIPDSVAGQLGNRIQHALRAYTPKDQKAVKSAAQTFRPNPSLSVESVITELGIGEALVSFLDGEGVPSMVERAYMLPPKSRIGGLSAEERKGLMDLSPFKGKYDTTMDRESAYEILMGKAAHVPEQTAKAGGSSRVVPLSGGGIRIIGGTGGISRSVGSGSFTGRASGSIRGRTGGASSSRLKAVSPASDFLSSLVGGASRTLGRQVGNKIVRGILGSIWK